MYFDPDWIFENKPDKHQYPNITGLMDDKPKPPKKKKPEVIESLADVFVKEPQIQRAEPITHPYFTKFSHTHDPNKPYSSSENYEVRKQNGTPQIINTSQLYEPERKLVEHQFDVMPRTLAERLPLEFEADFKKMIGGDVNWLIHERPGLAANPTHQQNYYGRQIGKPYTGEVITIQDPKYNIRQGLKVPVGVIGELQKYAQAGQLSPEQTLLLAAISSNEDEFGTTRGMFGINELYKDFPGGIRQIPGTYEANKLREYYNGDRYHDVIGWLKRKTNNFTDIERMNPGFQKDRNVNPRGETYTDRIMRNAEILLSNPEFLKALFGGQVPQLDLSQFKSN